MLLAETMRYPAYGLIAATTAAFFWSISVVMYRRIGRIMPPVMLNMSKGLMAALVLTFVLAGQWAIRAINSDDGWPTIVPWSDTIPLWMVGLMALSGVIGIGLGDTLLFAGLNRMGARRILLLFTINPVITVLIAWAFMNEPLAWPQVIGVVLTCGGVAWVIAERNAKKSDGHVDALGVIYGILAATCQATGVLISRYVFDRTDMSEVSSAWLRLLAGALFLFLCLPLDRLLKDPGGLDHHHPSHPSKAQATTMFFVALLLGTVGGIWLMQIAIKQSYRVGIASTLLSTSPLFVLPIAALLGEHISKRAVLGAFVTVGGIAILYTFSV